MLKKEMDILVFNYYENNVRKFFKKFNKDKIKFSLIY
jgi:hypothetical protein